MSLRRSFAAVLVVAVVTVAAGCGESSPSALDPEGAASDRVAGLWWLLFALGAATYAVVAGLIAFSWLRSRRDLRVNRFVAVGGVAIPAVVLVVVGVETVRATDDVFAAGGRDPDVVVEGERWWWRVSYPGEDVDGANEVHVPTGEPVTVELRSDNVVHSFWVPEISPKVDLVPGQTNQIVLEAEEPGTYLGACAEFCGLQHANMRFAVVAHEPDDYREWIEARRDPPPAPRGEAAEGLEVFLEQPCSGCHRVAGTGADATVGPDLSDVATRWRLGAGVVPNTPDAMADWVQDAPADKPGALMPPIELTDDEVDALVTYLRSLDPER